MREPPAAQPSRDRGDHPGRLGLLHQLQQPRRIQTGGRLQGRQLEVAAEDGGDLQDRLAAVGEPAEPLGHHRPDPLRQAGRQHQRTGPSGVERALAGQQTDDLGDKERVAVGLSVHRRRQRWGRRYPGDQGDEAGHFPLVQSAQQQPAVVLPAGQVGQGRQQWVPPVDLGVPVDAHYQQPGALQQLPAEKAQQGQRRRIGPVQVVEDQQQRPTGGRRPQEPGQAVEQPEPGRLRLDRRRGGKVWQALADSGD
jgi:hypothetical protein